MRKISLFATLILALGVVGCSDDDDEGGNNNNIQVPAELQVVTYNAGLARGFVDYADQRAPLTSQAVASLGADVVCVQEYWPPEYVAMLSADATDSLPNQIFLEDMPDTDVSEPACDASDLSPLKECVEANCSDVIPDEMVTCVLGRCYSEFTAQSDECQTCLGANVGGDILEVFEICTGGSATYAYGGAFGIGILTNQTMVDHDHVVLDSTLNRRAVLHAELQTEGFGTVHVFCTHLTAVFTNVPYPREGGSWAEEQAVQIQRMREWIDEKAGAASQVVLLGDFNCGPGGTGYVAEVEDNYNLLADGFTNIYPGMESPQCTFCDLNPLNGGLDHGESVLIDHVLIRGLAVNATAELILDQDVQVTPDATPITTKLSDHYGVAATLTEIIE